MTIKDCDVSTFTVRGPGGGGKDTSQTGVRVVHRASGATGKGTETRSYQQNRKKAFVDMANSKEFKAWHKKECAMRMGQLENIEETLQDQNLKIEYF